MKLRSWKLPLLLAAGVAARALLLSLPGLGRDEAAYLYWARHPEPAYSPLLQLALSWVDRIPADGAWLLRLPPLAGGVAALLLIRRLAPAPGKGLALALLLSPWWVYASSLVHPDAFLLPALLLLIWARREGRALLLALACLLAMWAKPSGLLALPATLFFLTESRLGSPRRRLAAAALACLASILILPVLRPEIFGALRQFGGADPGVARGWRWIMAGAAILLLPGPALLLAVFGSGRGRWLQREALLCALYFAAFAFAAVFWGQWKFSWFLPAIVGAAILPPAPGRPRTAAAFASAALSLLLALGLARPDWTQALESRLPALGPSYAAQAGGRERAVSSTGSWAERCAEYESLESFADSVRTLWTDSEAPQWILSDDYGLTAQLLAAWPLPECRMLLPDDGIFSASWPEGPLDPEARVLVISARRGRNESWFSRYWRPGDLHWDEHLRHPVSGRRLAVGRRL